MKKKLADEIGKAYVRLHCSHYAVIKEYEEQLKPCPFCGGKPKIRTWVIDLKTYYIVNCRKCEVKPSTARHTNIMYAVKAWNKRGDKE